MKRVLQLLKGLWRTLARLLPQILKDLWWTLAPLFVPLLAIVVIAALALPVGPALILFGLLGAAVAGLLWWWWHRAHRRPDLAVLRTPPYIAFGLLAGILLLSALAFILLARDDRLVDEYEVWARALVWAGFLFWLAAALLRLPVFATSGWRRLFVALFALAVVRYYVWLFVPWDAHLGIVDHVVWGLALVGLLAFIWTRERSQPAQDSSWIAGDFGVLAALLAAGTFVVAGLVGMKSDPPIKRIKLDFKVIDPDEFSAPADISLLTDEPHRLAEQFSPVLELTDGQRWRPTPVTEYLAHADLYDHRDRVIKPPPLSETDLDRKCPANARRLCYELTIHCALDVSDEESCEEDGSQDRHPGFAYARVLDRSKLPRDRSEALFPAKGPYHRQLEILVQYWLFYYYDDWQARTIFGEVRQGHEADWEVVTIGFSDKHPLFVALSAHCAGTWLPWDQVRLAGLILAPWHPMVAVAEGSQANYHDPARNIPPNWTRCNGVSAAEAEAANLAYKIRDRTGVSDVLELEVTLVGDTNPVVRFPGVWGRHNVTHFETAFGRRFELEDEGDGPESPGQKPEWKNPVHEIFCSDPEWKWVGSGEAPPYRC